MSQPTEKIVRRDRYPGIRSFEKSERRQFFGRLQETEDLRSLVKTRSLVVLFSKSGLGKSSLINAGLVPKLEEDGFFPVPVRFQNTDSSPLEIFERVLAWHLDEALLQKNLGGQQPELWHKIKACRFGEGRTPIFIFDQFEEFFNHSPQKRHDFVRQLADLADGRLPLSAQEFLQSTPRSERTPDMMAWHTPADARFLMAIRSDRLHEMNEMTAEIPTVLSSRFEIRPLDRTKAREAIVEPARLDDPAFLTAPFSFSEQALKDILDNLASKKADEVESFQLQILCGEVERRLQKEPKSAGFEVPADWLGGSTGIQNILNNYYENSIAGLGDSESQKLARGLVEDHLIADRKRIGVAVETVHLPKELVEKLLASRIIRISNTHLGDVFEISHDTLVDPIARSRDHRRLEEEKILAEKARLEAEQKLAEQEARFEKEKALREAAEKAKLEADAAREVAENAQKEAFLQKEKAQRNARRAFWFTASSFVLLLSSLVFGFFNLRQQKESFEKQAVFLTEQKQFREAAATYDALLDKEILRLMAFDRSKIKALADSCHVLEAIKKGVTEADSLYFKGEYRLALERYEAAKSKNYEDLGEKIAATEELLKLSFEIFGRKAETYFSLAEADKKDDFARTQACFWIEKALSLQPADPELLEKKERLGCQK